MPNNLPLESVEQIKVVRFCEDKSLKFTAIPNATYTPHMSVKMRNYREGVRPGFPDLIILITPQQAEDGQGHMLCVEMKRFKGGVVSEVQKAWAIALNGLESPNIEAVVAHGADEAKEYITGFLKYKEQSNDL